MELSPVAEAQEGDLPGMVTGHRRQHLGLALLSSSVGPRFRGRQFPFPLLSYMETDHRD